MTAVNRFVKVDVDPAVAWLTLDSDTRLLGPALALRFGNGGLLPDITLDELPDALCRDMAVDAKKRPAFRQRIAKLITKRLLVETSEGVKLLWSRDAFKAHARPKLAMVRAEVEAPANDQPSTTHRPPIDHPSTTHPKLSVENHSTQPAQRERERERIKRRPPTGAPAARVSRPRKLPGEPQPETPQSLLTRVVREECARGGQPPAAFTTRQVRGVLERGKFFAAKLGTDLEATFRRMASEAVAQHAQSGAAIDWGIIRWSDVPPAEPRLRYTGPKRCTPADQFPDRDVQEQLAELSAFKERARYKGPTVASLAREAALAKAASL